MHFKHLSGTAHCMHTYIPFPDMFTCVPRIDPNKDDLRLALPSQLSIRKLKLLHYSRLSELISTKQRISSDVWAFVCSTQRARRSSARRRFAIAAALCVRNLLLLPNAHAHMHPRILLIRCALGYLSMWHSYVQLHSILSTVEPGIPSVLSSQAHYSLLFRCPTHPSYRPSDHLRPHA